MHACSGMKDGEQLNAMAESTCRGGGDGEGELQLCLEKGPE